MACVQYFGISSAKALEIPVLHKAIFPQSTHNRHTPQLDSESKIWVFFSVINLCHVLSYVARLQQIYSSGSVGQKSVNHDHSLVQVWLRDALELLQS